MMKTLKSIDDKVLSNLSGGHMVQVGSGLRSLITNTVYGVGKSNPRDKISGGWVVGNG